MPEPARKGTSNAEQASAPPLAFTSFSPGDFDHKPATTVQPAASDREFCPLIPRIDLAESCSGSQERVVTLRTNQINDRFACLYG